MRIWSILKQFWPQPRRRFGAWQVELTTRCPLRCRMCIRQGIKDWRVQDMDIEALRRIAPYFREVGTVVLEGWGEALVYPHLLEAIQLVKDRGARAGFVTSGKDLTRDYSAALVRAGLDFIGFSLAGANAETHNSIRVHSDYAALLDAMADLVAVKREAGSSTPDIHIVYLLLRSNLHELPLLLATVNQLGIRDVLLIHLIHVTNSWQDRQRIFHCRTHEDDPSLRMAELLAGRLKTRLRHAAITPREVAVCAENPLQNLYVSVNGDVSPCVYLCPPTGAPFSRLFCGTEHMIERVTYGNLFTTPFEEIWNSPAYVAFREMIEKRRKAFGTRFGPFQPIVSIGRESREDRCQPELPAPPEPCRTCHKMLGV